MKSLNAKTLTTLTLAVSLVMVPELAYAQAGGSGQAAGLIAWIVTNLGRPALYAGVLLIAFLLFGGRISLQVILCIAAGGLVMANYGAIAGFFGF
jgi:hypothetical protein